ncbi:hypothetical protein [Citrobacter freundii]|uniref:hypothetical protein n=1 Tax=Citrobacter freundii TaxID=546 RepID=UPI001575E1B7|nr:hypothetical protein [Citrobacter freundii]NTX98493.1 hypothetical protein [Citrobacter freundii]
MRELSSAFTRTKGGEAPPLIRPPEISPGQAEGRASLTGPKKPGTGVGGDDGGGIIRG